MANYVIYDMSSILLTSGMEFNYIVLKIIFCIVLNLILVSIFLVKYSCIHSIMCFKIGAIVEATAWPAEVGATCHTAEATLVVLRPVFEDRIFSRRADVVWPTRSCDLTPLDYYLWGAVKDKCYADKPKAIDALKDNIRETIAEIQLLTIK